MQCDGSLSSSAQAGGWTCIYPQNIQQKKTFLWQKMWQDKKGQSQRYVSMWLNLFKKKYIYEIKNKKNIIIIIKHIMIENENVNMYGQGHRLKCTWTGARTRRRCSTLGESRVRWGGEAEVRRGREWIWGETRGKWSQQTGGTWKKGRRRTKIDRLSRSLCGYIP